MYRQTLRKQTTLQVRQDRSVNAQELTSKGWQHCMIWLSTCFRCGVSCQSTSQLNLQPNSCARMIQHWSQYKHKQVKMLPEAGNQCTKTGMSGGASSSSSSPPRALLNLLRCMSRLAAFLASSSGSSRGAACFPLCKQDATCLQPPDNSSDNTMQIKECRVLCSCQDNPYCLHSTAEHHVETRSHSSDIFCT